MKAVILAAGEGVRMRPLTNNCPKPMIKILGKPILHHIIDALPDEVNEIILVVGYLGDQIENYFGKDESNNFSCRCWNKIREIYKKFT